jgi:hypothetical protein
VAHDPLRAALQTRRRDEPTAGFNALAGIMDNKLLLVTNTPSLSA